MKLLILMSLQVLLGRAPQGARGLKYQHTQHNSAKTKSRPARGAWVEILSSLLSSLCWFVAPRKGRVG